MPWIAGMARRTSACWRPAAGRCWCRCGKREAEACRASRLRRPAPTFPPSREQVSGSLERLLGLHADLQPFYRRAAGDRRLHELAPRFRGLKPPRFPTVWEALVNAIACQQFSLTVGILLLNRLAELCGLSWGQDAAHAFPRPADLAAAAPGALRSLGFSGAKSREMIGLAKGIASGELDLASLEDVASGEAKARLMDLTGVGRSTFICC